MTRWLLLLTVAGCGRVGFESVDTRGVDGDAASDVTDGSAAPFCSLHSAATFCDDFESGTLARWEGSMLDKGTAMVSAAAAHEGAGGLVASIGTVATSSSGSAFVFQQIGPASSTAETLSFDVRIDGGDSTIYPVLATIGFNDATTNHRVEYVYSLPPNTGNIEEVVDMGSPAYFYYPFAAPSPGTWHHVRIATTTTHIDVTVDGGPVLSMNLAGSTGGQAYIQLGVPYVGGPVSTWATSFDNILVD